MGGTIDEIEVQGWMAAQERKARAALEERIRQLEKQCAVLAAEVDRQRPIVDAALVWNSTNYRDEDAVERALNALGNACDNYQASNPK